MAHHDGCAAGHDDIDHDMKLSSQVVMAMGDLEEDAASHDARIVLLEPRNTVANLGLNRIGLRQAVKRDLQWDGCHWDEYLDLR